MKQSIDRLCGALSGLALFGIMVLTFVDVSGRKALSQSVPGSLELTELLMVLVIFAALPLVSMQREHVQRWQRRIMDLVCAVGLLGVAYLMAQKGLQLHASGDTSSLLKIPHAPFVWLMSALAVVTALVHLRWMVAHALEDDTASVKG
jgi:TRAP-type transport system small permease protein